MLALDTVGTGWQCQSQSLAKVPNEATPTGVHLSAS